MATRMQQRRGTAQQWLDADPVLAAGEMGFETDTNEFRIGDGVNVWSDLSPFKNLEDLGGSLDDYVPVLTKGQANGVASLDSSGNVPAAQLANVIGGAGAALDTLNEISAALNNDSSYAATIVSALATKAGLTYVDLHKNATTSVHGIADTSALATKSYADTAVSNHDADTTMVHGISDTGNLVYSEDISDFIVLLDASTAAASAVSTHSADTTDVHGIANTANLATKSYADAAAEGAADAAEAAAITAAGTAADAAEAAAIIAAGTAADSKIATHSDDITNVHGIADTSLLATKTYADGKASDAQTAATSAAATAADTKISTHNSGTTSVHGIADTAALATKTYADGAVSTAVAALTKSSVGLANVDNTADTAKPVSTAQQTALDLKANLAGPTFTGTVSGITKSMVGLGSVDNTSDANKPVSSATQTALDLKSNLAGPTFTGTVVLPSTTSIGNVSSTEIGYVDGVTSAIQTQLDAKAPLAGPTFTGTTTTAALTVTGNLTVNGTTTTVSSTNLEVTDPLIYIGTGNAANSKDLGVVGHFDNGTYQHTGIVRDATDGKWKLFSGVTTEPSDTIDFTTYTKDALVVGALDATSATIGNVSNTELQYLDGVTSAIQTQIDAKAPSSSPTLATPTITGALTLSSSGVVFTDGTQTKEGVVSRTPIIQKTDSYTLSALTERDSLIEVSKATAATITVPLNSAVAYPVGTSIDILQTGAGQVSIVGAAGVTLNCAPSGGSNTAKLRTTWSSATLFKRASDTWVVFGDLTA